MRKNVLTWPWGAIAAKPRTGNALTCGLPRLELVIALALVATAIVEGAESPGQTQAKPTFIEWNAIRETYGVEKRSRTNLLEEVASPNKDSGFFLKPVKVSEQILLDASRNYGGRTYTPGTAVASLAGRTKDGVPEDIFYAGLGVGSVVNLRDRQLRIFGYDVFGGLVTIKAKGIEFSGKVEVPAAVPNSEVLVRERQFPILFDDPLVVRGKGIEIRQSYLDRMYYAFRANRNFIGQPIQEQARPNIEAEIIEKIIATKLCLQRATEDDKKQADNVAKEFIAEQVKQTASEAAFNRQLLVQGLTPEDYREQVSEQAIVKVVLDREIKARKVITEAEAKKYYEEKLESFEMPEMVRVTHILISTYDSETNTDLPDDQKRAKRNLADALLARARSGAEFGKLVREFSEDAITKDRGGEYTITRADQRMALSPEFTGAAFSLRANQVSDLVSTRFGFHIIKCLEKIPPQKTEYAAVAAKIKETLLQQAVEKELPAYLEKLKKDSQVEILSRTNVFGRRP